ncbi:MAG: FHA domain-containing protein [archaeon]|nr:FHA domain-containing protein [archaeon]
MYYIKDLGKGYGTFIKILDWTVIKNNFLLNMGENYVVFTIDNTSNENSSAGNSSLNNNSINVKIFSGKNNHQIFTFSPSKSPFTIGRSAECNIPIDDGMLSRIHCTIQFKDNQWYLNDGQMQDNGGIKKSTNGTWIYCLEDTPIYSGTTFKANHNLFICSFNTPNGNNF